MDKINDVISSVVYYLQSCGLIGGFFLIFLESIFPMLPLGIFIGFNIMAYGNVTGFLLSYFATVFGSVMSFTLFRFLLKKFFYKLFKEKTKEEIKKIMQKITYIDFNQLVVIIALPFTPAFLVNIAAGLSNISWKKYLISIFIGKIAIIYFWGFVGENILTNIKNPIVLLKTFIIVIIVYLISKIVEKIINVEERK